jgi:hypothetical protein
MYKVVIKDKYQVLGFKDRILGEYNNINDLMEATINIIRHKELITALKFVADTTHNVMEFGGRGYFTVSYYDVNYDE